VEPPCRQHCRHSAQALRLRLHCWQPAATTALLLLLLLLPDLLSVYYLLKKALQALDWTRALQKLRWLMVHADCMR
jgi:hypothetical protein